MKKTYSDEEINTYYSEQYPENQGINTIEQAAEKYINETADLPTDNIAMKYKIISESEIQCFIAGANSPESKKLHTKGMYEQEDLDELLATAKKLAKLNDELIQDKQKVFEHTDLIIETMKSMYDEKYLKCYTEEEVLKISTNAYFATRNITIQEFKEWFKENKK